MSESGFPRVRFSLKTLLIVMIVAAVGCWLVDRHTSDRARFEILETELRVEDGYLNGFISFRCSRMNENNNIEYDDTVLYVKEIADARLVSLKAGDEFFLRYRHRDFGPIARQNRYAMFLVQELGFRKKDIGPSIQMDGWSEILIRGKADGT